MFKLRLTLKPILLSTAAVATSEAASDVSGLGTAATLNVGTAANNIPQLDSNAKLPAIDGSQLTGLGVTQGTYKDVCPKRNRRHYLVSKCYPCPVVSVTKEVPQAGISTKGNWQM